ncbi:hypothetical protein THAOC_10854, partial [Thalassiosira oceanica]
GELNNDPNFRKALLEKLKLGVIKFMTDAPQGPRKCLWEQTGNSGPKRGLYVSLFPANNNYLGVKGPNGVSGCHWGYILPNNYLCCCEGPMGCWSSLGLYLANNYRCFEGPAATGVARCHWGYFLPHTDRQRHASVCWLVSEPSKAHNQLVWVGVTPRAPRVLQPGARN